LQPFCDARDRFDCIARAPADEQARMLGKLEQLHRAADVFGSRWRRWRCRDITRQRIDLAGQQQDVGRDLDKYRAGFAAGRNRIGLQQHWHHLIVAIDPEGGLGQAAHELVHVHLMQLVAEIDIGARAAADDQHRHAIQERFADAAAGMRQSGSGHHGQHTNRVRQAADRVSHERAAAFVRDQHWRDAL